MTVPPTIRVVIVDDHEMVADSFRRALGAEDDIEVVATVGTAAKAFEAALAYSPDVMLMDYLLPDMDGAAATARIREQVPEVKVVLLTGSALDEVLAGALAAGCVGFLEKTSALDKLASAIRAVASGEVLISAPARGGLGRRERATTGPTALTEREREVLALVAEGLSNRAIAERLTVSVHTVRSHVQRVLEKLSAHSKLEAAVVARKRGLLERP
jgi:DNA-binding NarL/FixJ family response regulator